MIIVKLRYAMIPSLRETGRRELMNCTCSSMQGISGDLSC